MTRQAWCSGIAVLLLGAAGFLTVARGDARAVPLPRSLEGLPSTIGRWSVAGVPPAHAFAADAGAQESLLRAYDDGAGQVWVAVGYYPYQAEGQRPAAQELLRPGRGWNELTEERVRLRPAGADPLDANLVVMRTGELRVAVLYWYQIGARSIASDHGYRAFLIYNRLIHRRSEGALVRVGLPVAAAEDPAAAVARAVEFVRGFYPELVRALPR